MDLTKACVLWPTLLLAAPVQRPGGHHRGSWQVQPQCPLPLASWQPGQPVVSTGTVSLLSHDPQPGLVWVWRGSNRGLAPQQKKGTSAFLICQADALLIITLKCTCPHHTSPGLALLVIHYTVHLLQALLKINDSAAQHDFVFSAHRTDQQLTISRVPISTAQLQVHSAHLQAARYNAWLLSELTPKDVVFVFSFLSFSAFSSA